MKARWSAPSLPCTLALFTPCNQETQPRKHRGEGGELATQDTSDGDRFLDHLRHIFHGKTTSAVFQAQRHSPVAVWTETGEGKWGQRFGDLNYPGEGRNSTATRGRVCINLTIVYVDQKEGGDLLSPVDDRIVGIL